MNRACTLVLAGLALLPIGVRADVITIDFDTFPDGSAVAGGSPIFNQYSSLGVSFLTLENGRSFDFPLAAQFGASASTGNNSLWNCIGTASECGVRQDILRIVFTSPVSDVSWYTNAQDPNGFEKITFEAYDASDVLLESIAVSSILPNFTFTTFSVGGIARIDALQPSETHAWSMDDLTFTTSVPEPGTLALFGFGLFGIALSRLRRT